MIDFGDPLDFGTGFSGGFTDEHEQDIEDSPEPDISLDFPITIDVTDSPYQVPLRLGFTVLLVDTASGAVTVVLPAVDRSKGNFVVIKKITSDMNVVTVDGGAVYGYSAGNIDGEGSTEVSGHNESITLVSDGIEWFIVSGYNNA